MEKQKSELIKEFSLVAFVLIGFVLILMIWSDSLSDREPQGPGFYREAMIIDDDLYLTMTAKATSGTPDLPRDHKSDHSTPTPTMVPITMTSTKAPTLISPTASIEFEQ